MKVEVNNNEITITLPRAKQPLSQVRMAIYSKASVPIPSTATIDGQPAIVGVNCYIRKAV